MKKLFVPSILAITVIIAAAILTSNASAQERLPKLWGSVTYCDSIGVGSGKSVEIWFEQHPHERPQWVLTDANNRYKWSFDPPQYFYKVRCRFYEGGTWYMGETIIDDTLTHDTRVDICVQQE